MDKLKAHRNNVRKYEMQGSVKPRHKLRAWQTRENVEYTMGNEWKD